MKIIVDKMPERPIDCPYRAKGPTMQCNYVTCSLVSSVCTDTAKCPVYISLDDAMDRLGDDRK